MTETKPPQFLSDFYRDLRDRHLLIPMVALLAALVAVPVLLGGGSEPEAAPPAPMPVKAADASAVQAAVFVEDGGIRNYRRRLEALKRENPFQQQFPVRAPKEDSGPSASPTAGVPTTGVDPSSTRGAAGTSTPTDSGVPAPTTATPRDDPSVEDPDDEFFFFEGTADIVFGPTGDAKPYKGVRAFDVFPSSRQAVVSFLGLGLDNDHAYFLLSPQVFESEGDGSCSPKEPAPCQILELAVGEERTIKVSDARTGVVTTYKLKLTGTDLVEIDDPRRSRMPAMALTSG